MVIPASTTVTSADTSWNGIIQAPTATTISLSISGFNTSVSSAIAVGSSDTDLTFSRAVKLTFPGQTGQHVGWYNHAGAFTEITAICTANDQATEDTNLVAGTSCKFDDSTDMIVWTKHFSTFTTYTQTAIVSGGGGGGGGGGNYIPPVTIPTPIPTPATSIVIAGCDSRTTGFSTITGQSCATNNSTIGQVLGASTIVGCDNGTAGFSVVTGQSCAGNSGTTTVGQVLGAESFHFSLTLKKGTKGNEVIELQNRLKAEGFFTTNSTGYFGDITLKAVKAYQKAHKLPQTGLVGHLTIVELNK